MLGLHNKRMKYLHKYFLLLVLLSHPSTSQELNNNNNEEPPLFLESVYGTKGALTYIDYLALTSFAKSKCNDNGEILRYIEVGSYLGMSATIIGKTCPNSLIFCHDIFPGSINELSNQSIPPPNQVQNMFHTFWNGIKRNKLEINITPMRGESKETLLLHDDNSFDLAFIDGDHSYEGTLHDLHMIWKLLKNNGGILLLHDAIIQSDGIDHNVRKAVKQFSKDINVLFFDISDSNGMIMMTKGTPPSELNIEHENLKFIYDTD